MDKEVGLISKAQLLEKFSSPDNLGWDNNSQLRFVDSGPKEEARILSLRREDISFGPDTALNMAKARYQLGARQLLASSRMFGESLDITKDLTTLTEPVLKGLRDRINDWRTTDGTSGTDPDDIKIELAGQLGNRKGEMDLDLVTWFCDDSLNQDPDAAVDVLTSAATRIKTNSGYIAEVDDIHIQALTFYRDKIVESHKK